MFGDGTRVRARKEAIVRAFAAADGYEDRAGLQRRVAEMLAERIAALALPPSPRICEVGCGTGFLSAALAGRIGGGDWLVSDICPPMIDRARARLEDPRFRFAVMDAERPEALAGEEPFDLICSSLAAQWFGDLEGTLQRLFRHVRPGGHLALTIPTAGTFAEWRTAHADVNLKPGTPDFPTADALRSIRLDGIAARVECDCVIEPYRDGRSFLSSLRAIGARTPAASHRPLNPLQMRAVLRRFEHNGAKATYHVATCIFTKRGA